MSVRVSVNSNPSCDCRHLLKDVETEKRNEWNRRRLLRIQQVRQQSKDFAISLREKVHGEHCDLQKENQTRQWQEKSLDTLTEKYRDCLKDIGLAHVKAARQPDPDELIREERSRNEMISGIRGESAMCILKCQQQIRRLEETVPARLKAYTRAKEDLRSTMIAALPSPPPKHKKPPSAKKKCSPVKKRGATTKQKKTRHILKDIPCNLPDGYVTVVKRVREDPGNDQIGHCSDNVGFDNGFADNQRMRSESPRNRCHCDPTCNCSRRKMGSSSPDEKDVSKAAKTTHGNTKNDGLEENNCSGGATGNRQRRYSDECHVTDLEEDSYDSDTTWPPRSRRSSSSGRGGGGQVHCYDHENRHQSSRPVPVASCVRRVEELPPGRRGRMAEEKEVEELTRRRAVECEARLKRGEEAARREQRRQDFDRLMRELSRLSREERKVRYTNCMKEPTFLGDTQRKMATKTRQKKMESAFEKEFLDPMIEDESEKYKACTPKLNVAEWKKADCADRIEVQRAKQNDKLTLSNLMKRIDEQREMLFHEIKNDTTSTAQEGANAQSSGNCIAQKLEAENQQNKAQKQFSSSISPEKHTGATNKTPCSVNCEAVLKDVSPSKCSEKLDCPKFVCQQYGIKDTDQGIGKSCEDVLEDVPPSKFSEKPNCPKFVCQQYGIENADQGIRKSYECSDELGSVDGNKEVPVHKIPKKIKPFRMPSPIPEVSESSYRQDDRECDDKKVDDHVDYGRKNTPKDCQVVDEKRNVEESRSPPKKKEGEKKKSSDEKNSDSSLATLYSLDMALSEVHVEKNGDEDDGEVACSNVKGLRIMVKVTGGKQCKNKKKKKAKTEEEKLLKGCKKLLEDKGNLRKRNTSGETSSTSYRSPPDHLSPKQLQLLSNLLKQIESKPEEKGMPLLKQYIVRLLSMNRENIALLGISSSDISLRSSLVQEMVGNLQDSKNSDPDIGSIEDFSKVNATNSSVSCEEKGVQVSLHEEGTSGKKGKTERKKEDVHQKVSHKAALDVNELDDLDVLTQKINKYFETKQNDKSDEIVRKYMELAKRYTDRISNLADLIGDVDTDIANGLHQSRIDNENVDSAKCSPDRSHGIVESAKSNPSRPSRGSQTPLESQSFAETTYKSLPSHARVIVPMGRLSPCKRYSPTFCEDNAPRPDVSWHEALAHSLPTRISPAPDEALWFRPKPPPTMLNHNNQLNPEMRTSSPHELSTINEVDSIHDSARPHTSPYKQTSYFNPLPQGFISPDKSIPLDDFVAPKAMQEDKSFQTMKSSSGSFSDLDLSAKDIKDESMPDVMEELIRRNIVSSPFGWLKEMEKNSKEEVCQDLVDEEVRRILRESPEDLEAVLENLGIGWGSTTLRKMRQAEELSGGSSSSPGVASSTPQAGKPKVRPFMGSETELSAILLKMRQAEELSGGSSGLPGVATSTPQAGKPKVRPFMDSETELWAILLKMRQDEELSGGSSGLPGVATSTPQAGKPKVRPVMGSETELSAIRLIASSSSDLALTPPDICLKPTQLSLSSSSSNT